MARIQYDLLLQDVDDLIQISNTDSDYINDVTVETLTNPPIKFTLLEAKYNKVSPADYDVAGSQKVKQELEEKVDDLIHCQLPDWRLIGASFSPTCFSMSYIAVRPDGEENCDDINYDWASSYWLNFDQAKVELEVDYTDSFPSRRYVAEMYFAIAKENSRNTSFHVDITEYFGKRKVRRIAFAEGETVKQGQLCHITEY